MAFNFPDNPTTGDQITNLLSGITYEYLGDRWEMIPSKGSIHFARLAATASYFDGETPLATTASYALTASYLEGGIESSSYAVSSSRAESSSTASYIDPTFISASIVEAGFISTPPA